MAAMLFPAGCAVVPAGGGHAPPSTLLGFYQGPLNHLNGVRRGACPMEPSCSEYARQAVARHGPVKGWMMAMDRLMRCGRDETRRAPTVLVNGHIKYYDPVDANDFWWSPPPARENPPLGN